VRTAAALIALLASATTLLPQTPETAVLKSHFAPGAPRYQYLPFEVPTATESLTISYTYNGNNGASVIDLGQHFPELKDLLNRSLRGDVTTEVEVRGEECGTGVEWWGCDGSVQKGSAKEGSDEAAARTGFERVRKTLHERGVSVAAGVK